MGTRGGLGTAEERYREALKDARGYPSSRRPVAVLDNLAGATSTWLDATSTRDDELGPILGTTKQSDRQNISFGAAPTAAELEAAEAAEERYREALRDAKGYVSEAVTPQKQRPIAQPLLGTSSKDEDGEYNEDSNDGDEFVKDNYALLTAEAETKVALLQPLHLFCRVYNRTPLSLQARADAKQAQLAAEEKMRGEQTSPPPKLAATAETEGQANLEDQFEAEVACWQERQEREARETEEEVTEKVRLAMHPPQPCTPRHAPCAHATCTLYACGARRRRQRCTRSSSHPHPHPHPHFNQPPKEAPEVARLEADAPRTESEAESEAEAAEMVEPEFVRYIQQLDAMGKEPAGKEPRSLFSRFDAAELEELEARVAAMAAAEEESYMISRQRAELEWTLTNPALRRRNGELDWTLVELYARSTMPTARTVRASMRPHRTPPPSPRRYDVRTGPRSLRTAPPNHAGRTYPPPSPHSPAVNGIPHVDLDTLFVRR